MGETQYVQYAVMNDWERIRAETARSNTRIIKILLFVLILLVSAIVLKSYFQPKVVEKIGLVFLKEIFILQEQPKDTFRTLKRNKVKITVRLGHSNYTLNNI